MDFLVGTKVLEEAESSVNGHIRVVKDLAWGVHIQAEGLTQSGGVVENIWKATLKKLRNKDIKDCLILGLGGGSAAKLVRKFWPEAKITGVDIDPIIVELGKKHLDLGKSRVKVVIDDALDFVGVRGKKKYDLILVDLYQGYNYPKKFESADSLKLIRRLLSDSGIAVFNRLYFADKRPEAMKFGKRLEKVFTKVEYFHPEANIMFMCSLDKTP
jgi:spermidine synthase